MPIGIALRSWTGLLSRTVLMVALTALPAVAQVPEANGKIIRCISGCDDPPPPPGQYNGTGPPHPAPPSPSPAPAPRPSQPDGRSKRIRDLVRRWAKEAERRLPQELASVPAAEPQARPAASHTFGTSIFNIDVSPKGDSAPLLIPGEGTPGSPVAIGNLMRASSILRTLYHCIDSTPCQTESLPVMSPEDARFMAEQIGRTLDGEPLQVVVPAPNLPSVSPGHAERLRQLVSETRVLSDQLVRLERDRAAIEPQLAEVSRTSPRGTIWVGPGPEPPERVAQREKETTLERQYNEILEKQQKAATELQRKQSELKREFILEP